MKYNKVDFNPEYAKMVSEEVFIASNQHQWPQIGAHERDSILSRVWQLCRDEETTSAEVFTDVKALTDGNSSDDAEEDGGSRPDRGIGGSDSGDSSGSPESE